MSNTHLSDEIQIILKETIDTEFVAENLVYRATIGKDETSSLLTLTCSQTDSFFL